MFVYKQFFTHIPVEQMSSLQWFALTSDYGKEYGNICVKYKLRRTPKLLDIGNGQVREMIEDTIVNADTEDGKKILKYSNPDEQYSGGMTNRRYHELVMKYFGDKYDGTIIDEKNLKKGEKYSKDDLEGPSEIVIFKDFDELLEEIHEGGKNIKKNEHTHNSKKGKSKKHKSKKHKSKKNKSKKSTKR
jgi:hypothetical protein